MEDARLKYFLGLSLFQKLCREEKKSFVISPLSLGTTLAMLSAGLKGNTKREVLNLLGTLDENALHAMYTELLANEELPLKIANKYLAERNCIVHPQFDSLLRVSCITHSDSTSHDFRECHQSCSELITPNFVEFSGKEIGFLT